jgi:hypothetical protein
MGFLFQDTGGSSQNVQSQLGALQQAQQGQMGLAQALQAQAAGQGANPALGLLQKGSEEAIKRSAGALASQRGINPALAQRLASQQAAEAGQQAAQSGAILQAQQSQQALQGLGSVYGQMGQTAAGAYQTAQDALLTKEKINQGVTEKLFGAGANVAGRALGMIPGVGQVFSGLGMSTGGHVPGKPVMGGDHPANDTVPAMLSPGEIVIPRTKAQNPELAKEFIDHVMKNKGGKVESNKEVTYADVLAAQKELQRMIAQLKG